MCNIPPEEIKTNMISNPLPQQNALKSDNILPYLDSWEYTDALIITFYDVR